MDPRPLLQHEHTSFPGSITRTQNDNLGSLQLTYVYSRRPVTSTLQQATQQATTHSRPPTIVYQCIGLGPPAPYASHQDMCLPDSNPCCRLITLQHHMITAAH
jgi:hypothetical protein